MKLQEIKKKIEKRFLGIRGWKDWEEYDRIRESTEGDKNCREELIGVCYDEIMDAVIGEIEETWAKHREEGKCEVPCDVCIYFTVLKEKLKGEEKT